MKFITTILLAACSTAVFGQSNMFDISGLGHPLSKLSTNSFQWKNNVPKSRQAELPKTLPVFRYSGKPRDFSTNALQRLIDQSHFHGTNIASLLGNHTNVASVETPIRLGTLQGVDRFFLDPHGGVIDYSTFETVNWRKEIPPYDAVPSFDSILVQVLQYAADFGISTNEMEHKENGSLILYRTDDTTAHLGGAIKYISARSLGVTRVAAGYQLLEGSIGKVNMEFGVKGVLLKFELTWPNMETVSTNRVFTIQEMVENIKKGQAVADKMNEYFDEYPKDGISEIILKDLRVFYYTPKSENSNFDSPNPIFFPIASFHAVFKSKSGKTLEGGIFTPLIEP